MEAHDWLAPASCSSCFDIRLFLFSFVSMVLIIFRQNVKTHIIRIIPASRLPCRVHRQRLGPSRSRRLRDSRFSFKCSKSVKRPSWNEKYENPGAKKPSASFLNIREETHSPCLAYFSYTIDLTFSWPSWPPRFEYATLSAWLTYLENIIKNFVLSDQFTVSRKKYKKRKLKHW